MDNNKLICWYNRSNTTNKYYIILDCENSITNIVNIIEQHQGNLNTKQNKQLIFIIYTGFKRFGDWYQAIDLAKKNNLMLITR
jgi:hypothetical protein